MSFKELRDAWNKRNEPQFAHMTTEAYGQWVDAYVRTKQGMRIGQDDIVFAHRHASYLQGRRFGLLDGIFWTLKKTVACLVALALLAYFGNWF